MKKYIKIGCLLLIGSTCLTSCLKDDMVTDQVYGMEGVDAFKIVELRDPSNSLSLLIENKTTTVDFVEVMLSAKDPAEEDLVVSLSTDGSADAIADYNAANNAHVVVFPSSKFQLPNGLNVFIPKGSRSGFLKLTLNQQDLDPSAPYGLAFKIVGVNKAGYQISGNYNNAFTKINAKNNYEGMYKATGTFFHPTAGARAINRDKAVTTVSVSTSRVEIGDLGGSNYYMYVQVNADNTVTILPDPTAATQDVFATGANTYDPATKTFNLNYAYNSAAPRRVEEVLKMN
ncbi:BT_3044 domain-containing protein [Pedobacter sp. MW01-1-1]|uniref:BT_3044 domain-containing protein n=1 Tax=Pedobacter sp. MW01-1-1 TaxID=3383027 RepID=UPI003FEF90C5